MLGLGVDCVGRRAYPWSIHIDPILPRMKKGMIAMAFYAWTQNVPITAEIYDEIDARIGTTPMPGLIVHLTIEHPDKSIGYLDVWESQEACDKAVDAVVHPAVHPVLAARGIHPPGEPPRMPTTVLDVRFGDGTTVRPT
ncbi:hypothetical protein [Gordonia sp. NB41Y]|nr:hypothetical protein [Gordonia sp. NB41Y]WLP91130.1 hypothetical protein Q9K23_02300 [Gordonia sp. NB41Y]